MHSISKLCRNFQGSILKGIRIVYVLNKCIVVTVQLSKSNISVSTNKEISHNACINFFQDKIRPTVKILYVSLLFSKYIILKSETSLFQKTILFTACPSNFHWHIFTTRFFSVCLITSSGVCLLSELF